MKQKLLLLSVLSVLVASLVSQFAFAQEAADEQSAEDESITITGEEQMPRGYTPESYRAEGRLQVGTVVQISSESSNVVQPATQDQLSKAFAVVISRNNLPLEVINTDREGEVYVATGGRHSALVTNENGPIESGDFLAVSSLSGTLMKSTPKQDIVFAKALASFDGETNTVGRTTLQDTEGRPFKQIGIGLIPISIEIIANPESEVSTKADLPEQLQRIGQAIAEKEVSPLRIYLSMAIMTISIIIGLAVLYVGIRSAIIAIGRNPLSKKSIFRALLQVILSSILVLIIGMFTVYLLLRL